MMNASPAVRLALISAIAALSAHLSDAAGVPSTQPIGGNILDAAAFAQWLDGRESPIADEAAKIGPSSVVWTAQGKPDWRGVKFGKGKAAGVRHLRIGFTEELALGSVLVRGGGILS